MDAKPNLPVRRRSSSALPTALIIVGALAISSCSSGASVTAKPMASSANAASSPVQPASPSPANAAMAEARFEGSYVFTRTVGAVDGLDFLYAPGQVQTRVYDVTPVCPSGPCDVSVVVRTPRQAETITLVFIWHDGVYSYDEVRPDPGWVCNRDGKTYPSMEAVTTTVLQPSASRDEGGVEVVTTFDPATVDFELRPSAAGAAAGCEVQTATMSGTLERTDDTAAALAGLSTTSAPRPATDLDASPSCRKEKAARAKANKGAVTFTLTNHTTSPVTLYYLDARGKRHEHVVFGPTGGGEQETFKSQPWVVTDEAGRCLLFFNGANKTYDLK